MNDGLIVNGKTLHPDMKAMLDARANAGPAETIAEQRTAWTAYSQALSQPHPDDMKVEDRDLPLPHGAIPSASIRRPVPMKTHPASSTRMAAVS